MGAFLFNGKKLPVLPSWDKTLHPDAIIAFWDLGSSGTKAEFIVQNAQYTVGSDSCFGSLGSSDPGLRWTSVNGEDWRGPEESNGPYFYASFLLWSNYDVYNEDGTLYLAASDPVPVPTVNTIDPTSLTIGQLIGRVILGQRCRRPTGYLCNGVLVPVWDQRVYPYAIIDGDIKRLYVTSLPMGYHYNSAMGWIARTIDGSVAKYLVAQIDADTATFEEEVYEASFIPLWLGDELWSNYDLIQYNNDGTESLILAASDPVPVYE